jgi:ADP-ribose pyrophosphatase YjhB (NUDIX family)
MEKSANNEVNVDEVAGKMIKAEATKAETGAVNIRTPFVAVDIIIRYKGGIVLVKRSTEPFGWALPGGLVEYGETLEQAAVREAKEETNLDITLVKQLHTYSDPKRDPRNHCVSVVFVAEGKGEMKPSDETSEVEVCMENMIPKLCFNHNQVIMDYFNDDDYEMYE